MYGILCAAISIAESFEKIVTGTVVVSCNELGEWGGGFIEEDK